MQLFHPPLPVRDLEEARAFYADVLGADAVGVTPDSVTLTLCGHRMSLHRAPPEPAAAPQLRLDLPQTDWTALAGRLEEAAADFITAPQRRERGTPGEHWFLAVRDPAGNRLEIRGLPESGDPPAPSSP